ncbi:MAG: inorganic phosphate transporter [Clostridia bacterium]|nr:inorganic phosphate transporter [Clostridia bacterium]
MHSVIIPLALAYGVLFVNGWTDAPNSIATAVSTNAISYKKATVLCGCFNLLGVVIAYFVSTSVAEFVFTAGNLSGYTSIGISVVFLTMILFGVVCWYFGLPSSESHAMISGLAGASFAVTGETESIKKVGYVVIFMVFSCVIAFILSYASRLIFRWNLDYRRLQILSCSLTSFMHGWQGGLKFIGIIAFLLGIDISKRNIPFWLMISVATVLALGALMGGKRIIDSMGESIVKMRHISAFSSDIGTYLALIICSLLGMPVSTGNIKCLAIMGVGVCEKQPLNKKTTTKLFVSFIVVFPVCFLVSYLIMKLFLKY